MDGLTVGRMVHYVRHDGEHCAAIVVAVVDDVKFGAVNLHVHINGVGLGREALIEWMPSVLYDENKARGTWHWIEKA